MGQYQDRLNENVRESFRKTSSLFMVDRSEVSQFLDKHSL